MAVDDGAGADDFVYGAGRIGVEDADGSTATFSYNPFGSALATAATADWARSASYSPFGQQQNASWADPLAHTPAFGYRSELTLDNTIHLRARTYEPAEGRFTTRDPLDGVAGTTVFTSPYAYANNDPLTFADPLGLSVTDEAMEECAVEAFVHELSFDSDPQFADECIAELLIRQKEEQLNADHTQLVLEQAAALIQAYTETGEVLLSIATGECGPAVVDAVEGTGSTGSAVSGCAKEAAIELAFNGFALAGDLSWVLRHSDEVGDVAEDALPALRQAYFDDFAELSDQVAAWYRAGADPELIAREAWANRRALGMKYKDLTPTDYLEEVVFPRNLERYGDKWGPTWEYTVDHYDSNWEVIIEKSLTPGGFDLGIGPR
ncbi:MAG: RHS repeat-associated core domain-containing protein [Actinobacteria bacterium]|nr:MAG: RHS repeat-associated core domain-containing protein [Actinomycetota bacterium]RIK02213.1 MAG: hypothetical protein DCC48_18390 [Acidobacteriota bacterium]